MFEDADRDDFVPVNLAETEDDAVLHVQTSVQGQRYETAGDGSAEFLPAIVLILHLAVFGDNRILEILSDKSLDNAKKVVLRLMAEVDQHRNGAEPNDDLTMLCLRVD